MLIEFSVSNFRSFRERQTFSMVAAPRLKKAGRVFKPDVDGEHLPELLRVAAIYGPNASGKSSLLSAISVFQKVSRLTPSIEPIALPVSPFRFDPLLSDKPSRFEIHFIQDRQRYQFELGLTKDRIFEEKLIAYPKGIETLLYERVHANGVDNYKIGEKLEGGAALHTAWKNLTGPQVLFLSQAVANSNEELNQLRKPLTWIQGEYSVVEDSHMDYWARVVQAIGITRSDVGNVLAEYLRAVDVPVSGIEFKDNTNTDHQRRAWKNGEPPIELIKDLIAPDKEHKTTLTHTTSLGSADFDFSEESRGTRNLIGFYMPWSVMKKHVVIVDEFDSSLHPKIVAELVRKFIESPSAGQLIFTTHDTHLMDAKLLRRDQFWLTERNSAGATRLRSIHDFRGRDSEDIEKRYYEGHYRALPVLNNSEGENTPTVVGEG